MCTNDNASISLHNTFAPLQDIDDNDTDALDININVSIESGAFVLKQRFN